jgi:hypothetical protein
MSVTIQTNIPLLLGLLLALATYLVAVSLPLGPDRPSLAEWLARHERRPPAGPRAAAAPEFRSPLTGGLLGPPLAAAARRAVGLAESFGLGHPDHLSRRLAQAGHGTPIDHYVQKVGSAGVLTVAGLGLLALTGPLLGGRGPACPGGRRPRSARSASSCPTCWSTGACAAAAPCCGPGCRRCSTG